MRNVSFGFWKRMLAFSEDVFFRLFGMIRFLLLDVFFSTTVVNACVYTVFGKIKHFNLGDDLNYFLVKKMQSRRVVILRDSIMNRIPFGKKENYLIIGSTVSFLTNRRTCVWGAGVVDDKEPLKEKPLKVYAVRGPLTRRYLLENGVDCPPIYGDPALLVKFFYKPQEKKKYKLGIIPHYADYSSAKFDSLKKNPEILFIKMNGYKSVEDVISKISSCQLILSSSLHGLIISESYGIPNIWMKVSDSIRGGSFKYLDYYESINIHDAEPYVFSGNESIEGLLKLSSKYKKGNIDLKPLIDASPFEILIK